jgi:hypothetical protein
MKEGSKKKDEHSPAGVSIETTMSIVAVVAAVGYNMWMHHNNHDKDPSSSNADEVEDSSISSMFKGSASWLIVAALSTVVWFRIATMPKVECSKRFLSNLSMSVCLIGGIPFVRPLSGTGPSLTGLKLSDTDQPKINVHAILFAVMFLLLMTQLLSSGNSHKATKKIHSVVGRFMVFAYVPLVLTELTINSGMVFLTSKIGLLGQALATYSSNATTTSTIAEEVLAFSAKNIVGAVIIWTGALLVPPMLAFYFWMAMRALWWNADKKRDVRLHTTYMTMFIFETMATGVVRICIHSLFTLSRSCKPFGVETDVIQIQASASLLAAVINFLVKCFLQTTLPFGKDRTTMRRIHSIDIYLLCIQCVVASQVGLPVLHDC